MYGPNYFIVDARSPDEYLAGHIRGSINIWNSLDILKL